MGRFGLVRVDPALGRIAHRGWSAYRRRQRRTGLSSLAERSVRHLFAAYSSETVLLKAECLALISHTDPRDQLSEYARHAFSFLEEMRAAKNQRSAGPTLSELSFSLDDLFVQIELDWSDQAVFTLLGFLTGDRTPGGYYVHQNRRVRWHLDAVISLDGDSGAARAAGLRRLTKESGPTAMKRQIDAGAAEIKRARGRLPGILSRLSAVAPNSQKGSAGAAFNVRRPRERLMSAMVDEVQIPE